MPRKISAVAMLARRFVLSKSSDGFLSFIAWVSVIGVALGVLALTVVTSVINGFEGELVRVITGMNGDVVLYSRGEPIRDVEAVEGKIRKVLPEVQAISPAFLTELMISGPGGVAGAVLEGIEDETIGLVTAIPDRVVGGGRMPNAKGEVALGASLADRIGATVGSDIRLIIPLFNESSEKGAADSTPSASGAPKVMTAKVVGLVRMGMYEYDSKFMFAPLFSVQDFLGQPGRVTSFYMKLLPDADSRKASDKLTDTFGYPFRSKDWAQMNKNLFYAIKLEKVVISIILTVIVIVAAFNVVSTLMMMIHDKIKEISILKAMGLRQTQSFRIFCVIGLVMGIVGTVIGIALGMAINSLIRHTRLIELPADIYYIGFLPVVTRWAEVGVIALVALGISFLATLYPGWKAARRSPLDGLRYE